MSNCDDLLDKARRNPVGVRFVEVITLAECWGFVHRNSRGTSHRVYKRPGTLQMLNFQPGRNGKAKRLQVQQLLKVIDELIESKGDTT